MIASYLGGGGRDFGVFFPLEGGVVILARIFILSSRGG